MIYRYKCEECKEIIDYVCSITEPHPDYIPCECGGNMVYDWGQFSKESIFIPERHKA